MGQRGYGVALDIKAAEILLVSNDVFMTALV